VINGEGAIYLLISLVYWALRRLLELVLLRQRSENSKELEILVLRHQLHVLQRQVARPRLRPADRLLLAALSRSLPRSAWSTLFVSPATLLRWHRELVARRWTYSRRTVGRPRKDGGITELVLRLARVRIRPGAIGASRASLSGLASGSRPVPSGRFCAGTGSSRRRRDGRS
jgi:putative transposase